MSHAKYFVTKKNLLSTTRAVLDISPNRVLVRVVGTHEVLFDTNGEELAHVEREGSSSFRLRSGRAKIKLSCDDAVAVVAALKLHMDQNPEIMEAKLKRYHDFDALLKTCFKVPHFFHFFTLISAAPLPRTVPCIFRPQGFPCTLEVVTGARSTTVLCTGRCLT